MTATPESIQIAHKYLDKGVGHLHGVLAVKSHSEAYAVEMGEADVQKFVFNRHFSASLHLLVGFAAELMLKAAYLFNDGEVDQTRKFEVRHDLIALLDIAEATGFACDDPNTREVFELYREPHKDFWFRYENPDQIPLPAIDQTIAVLEHLAAQLQSEYLPKD